MGTNINRTQRYMILAKCPLEGHGTADELLVSLTLGDLISAWNEITLAASPLQTVPVWDALLPEQRDQIIQAARNMDVGLWSIFHDFARQYQDMEFARCVRCGEPLKY